MKIVFWNAAGVKDSRSYAAGEFKHMVDNIILATNASIIIFCEINEGFQIDVPQGYIQVDIDNSVADYKAGKSGEVKYAKRYMVLAKSGGKGFNAILVESDYPRPGLAIISKVGWGLLAIHGPSAGQKTQTPQSMALYHAISSYNLLFNRLPMVVFGDINVNADDDGKVASVGTKLGDIGKHYAPSIPKEPTHGNSKLDWALVQIGKDIVCENAPQIVADGLDEDYDKNDPPFDMEFDFTDKSDHSAILITFKNFEDFC